MTLRRSLFVVLAGVLGFVSGCAAPGTEPASPSPGTPLTTLPRDLSPAERSVLASSTTFTLALWRELNATEKDSNVFVSPLSASFSLGMALTGAAGRSFDELRAGLGFGGASLSDIDAGYKSLIALLTSLDQSVTMQVANSIWYRKDFPFNQSFLNDGATYFNAVIKPLDFNDTVGSLSAINAWVSDQTGGRISKIVDEIRPENVMFLINAIYFKGSWRTKFDPALTHDAAFHAVGGDQTAHFMNRDGAMGYFDAAAFTAVDLAYGDSAFTMTVLVPKVGDVESLAASLDAATWASVVAGLRTTEVNLFLPKLTLSWKRDLIPDLQALGVHAPFDPNGADFTGMSSRGHELYLSSVRQKTFVDINEEGTEAAAVTSTGVSATAVHIPPVVRVDRPFVFVIRERLTGAVIFAGKIVRLPT